MQKTNWLWPILIILTLTGMLLPLSPLYRPVPSDDPSVYLYVGQTMLDGGAPYKDAWDHKQPLAYFLFALGLILSPASLWGIWVVELVLFATAGVLAYLLLSKAGASRPLSALSVMVGMLGIFPILWSYSVEELSLAFQVFVLYAFYRYFHSSHKARLALAFSIGAASGVLFFLKQSLIAACLAVGLYLLLDMLLRRDWRKLAHLASMLGGFVLVCGLVALYLWRNGAIESYISAAFTFNFRYAGLGLVERTGAALDALEYMGSIPALWLSIVLWITCTGVALLQSGPALARWLCKPTARLLLLITGAGLAALSLLVEVVSRQPGFGLMQRAALGAGLLLLAGGALLTTRVRERVTRALSAAPVLPPGESTDLAQPSHQLREALFYIAVMLFPLTLLLLTLSGRNYVYYFITFGPFLILSLGLVGSLLLDLLREGVARRAFYALMVGAGLALLYNPALLLASGYQSQVNPPLSPLIDYVRSSTNPGDTIMAWGKESTSIYFLAQRRAPTRYFYQAAIWQADYNARVGAAREILTAMKNRPPALFVVYGSPPAGDFGACPLGVGDGDNSEGAVLRFVCERYDYIQPVGDFLVFALKKGN